MEYFILESQEEIKEIIPHLIKNKLYEYKAWRMYQLYYPNPYLIQKLSYCKIKNKIVGVALYLIEETPDFNVSVFVKKSQRRKGIGTKLIQILNIKEPKVYLNGYREHFWKKVINE